MEISRQGHLNDMPEHWFVLKINRNTYQSRFIFLAKTVKNSLKQVLCFCHEKFKYPKCTSKSTDTSQPTESLLWLKIDRRAGIRNVVKLNPLVSVYSAF